MQLSKDWAEKIVKAGKTQQDGFEKLYTGFQSRSDDLVSKLMALILKEYMPKFDVDSEGSVLYNTKNIALANQLELTFDKFNNLYYKSYLGNFASDNLRFVDLTMAYYGALGVSEAVLAPAARNIEKLLAQRMGISIGSGLSDSKIIKGSYLDNLLKAAPVREQVKNFVLQSVAGRAAYKDFLGGMQTMVAGNEDVDGRLMRYVKQYTFDTYSQSQAIVSSQFAEQAGFTHWYYQGSLIETSREFCQNWAGQIITQDDIDNFDADDWPGKIPDIPFTVQRGGYNCRHFLDGIPDEAVNEDQPVE